MWRFSYTPGDLPGDRIQSYFSLTQLSAPQIGGKSFCVKNTTCPIGPCTFSEPAFNLLSAEPLLSAVSGMSSEEDLVPTLTKLVPGLLTFRFTQGNSGLERCQAWQKKKKSLELNLATCLIYLCVHSKREWYWCVWLGLVGGFIHSPQICTRSLFCTDTAPGTGEAADPTLVKLTVWWW